MAEKFYTILTNVGLAKIANSQVTGNKVNLVEMAVGDSNGSYYNPTSNDVTLRNEKWRGPIGSVEIDEDNANWIVIETVIPSETGGFTLREVGLFDEEGDLIAIGKYPETYKPVLDEGSAKDLYIRMIIEVSNASAVTLKVDPTVIIASRKYVDEKIALAVGPINQSLEDLQTLIGEYQQDLAAHLAEDASLVKKGHVQLSNATDSASESLAATPKAIKEVMDKAQEAFTLGNSRKKELVDLLLSLDDSLPLNHSSSWDDIFSVAGSTSTGKKWATGEASTVGVNPRRVLVSGLSFKPSYILSIRANSKFNIAAFGDMVSLGASYDLGVQVDNYPRVGYVLATLNEDGFSLPVSDDSGSWVWIALE